MLLIRGGEVRSPDFAGHREILCAGERIELMERRIATTGLPRVETLDADGLLVLPGFVDNHVHILGGGGEGGPATRTPELSVEDALAGGVTTVIGVIGTDDVTRSLASLVAKSRGLEAEGITCRVLLGSYQLPLSPLTGSVRSDIALVEAIIGVGEVAISDHRSSQPVFDEMARIAAAARVGGMLKGMGGKVNIHLGDGGRGLSMLREIAERTEIPIDQFLPTHVNRNAALFDEAVEYALAGGVVDLTTSTTPLFLEEGEVKCSKGLKRLLEAGVPEARISFSSDGQGSLPDFDAEGRLKGLTVGTLSSLFEEVRDAVLQEGVPLEKAVAAITSSPALFHGLPRKGFVREGYDADLVIVDRTDLSIRHVVARGRVAVRDGELLLRSTFSPARR